MAIDFPASPTVGDTFTSGGVTYEWDGTVWTAAGAATINGFLPLTGGTVTGDIDVTGNVGIGTSSPATPLHVQNNDGAPGGIIQRWSADLGVNNRNANIIAPEVDDTSSPFTFFTNSSWNFRVDTTDALTINSIGNVGIGTSSPGVELDVNGEIRASTGILFGTDTAAANTLDDYEQGTYTPSFQNGSWTYTNRDGYYTKVGNMVTVWLSISWSSRPTGQNLKINLPFTPATGVEQSGAISNNGNLNYQSAQYEMACSIGSGQTVLIVRILRDGLDRLTAGSSALASSATFAASISYRAQ